MVVADPCPHGIPADLCAVLCTDTPSAIATVDPGRPVGYALALDCHLAGTAPHRLGDIQLLDVIDGAERLERWITALRTRMIGVFAARHPPGSKAAPPGADPRAIAPVSRWLPDQLAIVLGVSIEEARALLAGALRFVQVLPATLADWEAGRIDERKAATIAQRTGVLSDELAREVEAAILPGAAQAHQRLLRDRLRRAIAKADPEGAKRRHEKAKADRRMSISRGEDGMASLYLGGTAEQTEASWQSVDRLARAVGQDDPRTLAQKRLDLAHQLLQGTLTITDLGSVRTAVDSVLAAAAASTGTAAGPGPADTGAAGAAIPAEMVAEAVAQALQHKPDPNEVIGRKPLIHVVVSLDTLLGGDRPAEIVGHGPIPALTARALAAGGVWKRLVTDPLSGALLDHGRTTYSPPDGLADHVKARDVICRGALCSRSIRELDHHIPWAGGGETNEENLYGFCQHGRVMAGV
ncbi:HNH endonuclease [Pseudonocardia ammonioxydans]|uniref:HNH endonuclease n=1 Tax=Pseudonocardia ammonioxydans TaxID=260086 RepID=UPI0015A69021|nr:HNH endonuclease signature motif containing protein [Pseudonocardia ammonioxydans]